jgi:hypothetical protein
LSQCVVDESKPSLRYPFPYHNAGRIDAVSSHRDVGLGGKARGGELSLVHSNDDFRVSVIPKDVASWRSEGEVKLIKWRLLTLESPPKSEVWKCLVLRWVRRGRVPLKATC